MTYKNKLQFEDQIDRKGGQEEEQAARNMYMSRGRTPSWPTKDPSRLGSPEIPEKFYPGYPRNFDLRL